ncbi:hypothetical protein Q2T40_01815 [Winogradskyella maritima]|nr:hypothetical protein [Winogradskyella maritima]
MEQIRYCQKRYSNLFSISKSSENVNDAIEIYANNYADLPEDNGKEVLQKKQKKLSKKSMELL